LHHACGAALSHEQGLLSIPVHCFFAGCATSHGMHTFSGRLSPIALYCSGLLAWLKMLGRPWSRSIGSARFAYSLSQTTTASRSADLGPKTSCARFG
jgi:hypothetical protein